MSARGAGRLAQLVLGLALLVLAVFAPAASATRIYAFNAVPSTIRAGAHPDIGFSFTIGNRQTAAGTDPCGCTEDAKDTTVHLPTGLIGIPSAIPRCSAAQFAVDQCPVDSQLGFIEVGLNTGIGTGGGSGTVAISPVFNLSPPPSQPALLGFKIGLTNSPTLEVVGARTGGDYGIDTTVSNIDHVVPLTRIKQVIWGIPAAPSHDRLRFELGEGIPTLILAKTENVLTCDESDQPSTDDPGTAVKLCSAYNANPSNAVGLSGPVASNSPLAPFSQNPTTCGEASLKTSLDVLSYDRTETHADAPWPATTNCAQLAFNPSLFARPTSEETDSPSGIDVDLKAPQFESPETPSPSEIRTTKVTLPPGFTVNPNAADGKLSCADAEAKFGTTEEAQCPEFAKIGSLEVHSPALPGVLPGAIYIGQPLPGERYRLFLTFDGFGVHVKLAGAVHPDPQTGQIVTEFRDLPQFPFEDFDLHFFGSQRGILATPTQCGSYPVATEFEPWDAALPNQTSTQFFNLTNGPGGAPCPNGPRPFSPSLKAASVSSAAGVHTSFSLNISRGDGEQNLSGLTLSTPPGFSATLAGIPYCPEASIAAAGLPGYSGLSELATPSCPPASQVGEAIAGSGAGAHPFYAPGKVYLAGPYKGAPLSFVVITPALSGPYDLGNVVVRTALHVDPNNAQVTAIADPLPQILEGIPLRLRSILVNLNRPGFALNPTDCEPLKTTATLGGSEGALATPSAPFQASNCAAMPFKPKLSLRLKGSIRRSANPKLIANLTMKPGEANVSRAQVKLPPAAFLDQGHIGTPCTKVIFVEGAEPGEKCPPSSVIGRAKAVTPLLQAPLEGNVYLRSPLPGHELPDVVAALNGQIDVALVGKTDSVKGALRNTFETVPDAPVSFFHLELFGGRRGLIEMSEGFCSHPDAAVQLSAQNGRLARSTPVVASSCGAAKEHKRHATRGGAR